MPLSGGDLGAELVDLRHAGRIGLPRIAEVYVLANNKLAGSSDGDSGFQRSYGGHQGGASSGAVYPEWTALRNQMQTILGNTANNVEHAGEIVVGIADTYAENDGEAATSLNSAWENRPIDENDDRDRPLNNDLPEPEFP